jgi:plastocyanin
VPSFRPLLLLPLVLAAVLLPGAAQSAATATPLNVTVGPGFTIKVTDATGHSVTQLDAGDYALTIKNLSLAQEHNFHIIGPPGSGVDQFSAFDNNTVTWNLTFVNGTYHWKCDAHPTQMKGDIHVGPLPPAPVKLTGKVGPKKTISLKKGTATVKALVAGRYKVVVTDATKVDNFHLTGPGVNKKTGVKTKTGATWTLTLKRGKYTFRSDATKKLKRTFSVG